MSNPSEQHQGLPVGGYRPQPDEAVDVVNGFKVLEEEVLRVLDQLADNLLLAADKRWLALSRTHFEEGFMALNRSVFKPQRLTDADIARLRG